MTLAAKTKEDMRCFKKTVCIVGATSPLQKLQEESARGIKPITLAHGVDQFRSGPNDSGLLAVPTDHEPCGVVHEDQGNSLLIAIHDESSGLLR